MRDSELIVRADGEQQIFYVETFLLNSLHSKKTTITRLTIMHPLYYVTTYPSVL